jgi:hypothetical protein
MRNGKSSHGRGSSTAALRTCAQSESGVSLIIAIVGLLLITAVAAAMILLSTSETNVDANYRDQQIALFAAKAGMEEARDRMLPSNANHVALPVNQLPGTAGSIVYITASGVTPWLNSTQNGVNMYDCGLLGVAGTGPCISNGEIKTAGLASPSGSWYTNYASNTNYEGPAANPLPYQWVRINLKVDGSAVPYSVDGVSTNSAKQVYYDLANLHECVIGTTANCVTTNTNLEPVYEITSFAVTASGTQRMLQQEVVEDPLSVNLTLPGALTVDGTIGKKSSSTDNICDSGSTCNGSGAYLTGTNPASCPTGATVPAIATADPTSTTNLTTDITANKTNIVGSGGSPSVVNESSALTNLSTPAQIEALVGQMENVASTNSCNTPANPQSCSSATLNLGTSASPTITVVNNAGGSAFQLNSGTTGYGILVLTGDLDYVNVNSYEGVILMLGTAQFTETSSKDTTFTGALFMAQDRCPSVGASPGPCTSVGQLMTGLGSPTFNYHHGNASSTDPSIQYNQCIVNQVEALGSSVSNYRVLLQREIPH